MLIRCLDPAGARPTAMELLEDPFFAKPKLPPPEQARRPSGLLQLEPEGGGGHHRGANHQQQDGGASSEGEEACEVGALLCLWRIMEIACHATSACSMPHPCLLSDPRENYSLRCMPAGSVTLLCKFSWRSRVLGLHYWQAPGDNVQCSWEE